MSVIMYIEKVHNVHIYIHTHIDNIRKLFGKVQLIKE